MFLRKTLREQGARVRGFDFSAVILCCVFSVSLMEQADMEQSRNVGETKYSVTREAQCFFSPLILSPVCSLSV